MTPYIIKHCQIIVKYINFTIFIEIIFNVRMSNVFYNTIEKLYTNQNLGTFRHAIKYYAPFYVMKHRIETTIT